MENQNETRMTTTRSWAEQIGPTTVRFHHPCGHTSTKDFAKGPKPKRIGEMGVRMLSRYWRKENGGVTAPCPRCARKGGAR